MPRHPDDFYETPAWCVDRLVERMSPQWKRSGRWVIDPCAGNGAIVKACKAHGLRWTWLMQELREEEKGPLQRIATHVKICDSLKEPHLHGADLLITNPPYKLAQEFVEKFTDVVPSSFWLLRLNFLGSKKRKPMWARRAVNVYVLPNRPSFTPDGKTDATEYAWFEFGAGAEGRLEVLELTPKERIRAEA